MPKRQKKTQGQSPIQPEPKLEMVTIEKKAFQALHSAARALFRQVSQTDNHSADTLLYLQMLDAAIDDGHLVLGTQRPYADQYIHIIKGLTDVQMQNAKRILANEGLLPSE